ncbi:Uncharacterised protein [Mycobacteroides abscessus subsp. abscessus]|nr:Uncharacterised protein [Mycobacteroides abscessus subsp. abscessus]
MYTLSISDTTCARNVDASSGCARICAAACLTAPACCEVLARTLRACASASIAGRTDSAAVVMTLPTPAPAALLPSAARPSIVSSPKALVRLSTTLLTASSAA